MFAMPTVEVHNLYKLLTLDCFPARFVKYAAELTATSITHLNNVFIEQCKEPNELKFAKLIPLYKKKIATYLSQNSAACRMCWKERFIARFMHIFRLVFLFTVRIQKVLFQRYMFD